jgi:YidC/Oxa1 family membrane protein insertase
MGSMDRNTVIGFSLLAVLLISYLFFTSKSSQELALQRKRTEDSIARITRINDSIRIANDTTANAVAVHDTTINAAKFGTEQFQVVENDVFRITFTNKGGQPKAVELKKFKTPEGKPVVLGGSDFDKISYAVNTSPNQSGQISELYFAPLATRKEGNVQVVTYQLTSRDGQTITHQFSIRPDDYMIDWNVQMNGADRLLTQGVVNMIWQNQPMQQQRDVIYERRLTDICFYEEGFDYIQSRTSRKFDKPLTWLSVAQQFFNTTLVAKNNFTSGEVNWSRETSDTSRVVARSTATFQAKVPLGASASIPFQIYYGPNDFRILRNQTPPDMDKIVNLGRDMYAFVRPINKYIVMPVFDFFNSFIGSMGLVIALLTLFIRLLTSPLVYTSYLSGAKMKALKPEIDAMKKRLGNDQQAVGMEQMRLFREAGVNPLGGCIPALLQIPIFFALYSFFNSNIALRHVSFLWAQDLSSYDAIIRFPFHVWGLGNHLSLFTITAVTTSFLISLYNMNMTPDSGNPAMKYMPYIFPFILLFIFNSLPSALTWYYTVSNVITLILQFVIQNYIINHDKILAKIEANRKKPKTKPKWQERFEQMQQEQKKLQDSKTKPQARR